MHHSDKIDQILSNLPSDPGVYLMKDGGDAILYIGKASNLKKRVSSYFQKKNTDAKTEVLVKKIADIECIVTDSEIEALILESNLVRKHKPKFNIRLKDDKRFPYIAVSLSEKYPRVLFTRKITSKQNRYFGPYTDARAARNIVSMTNALFKLKTCKKEIPLRDGERPCLNYQMKRCSGVCTGIISRVEYLDLVNTAVHFLEGDMEPVMNTLQGKMKTYAETFQYEKAAQIRDIMFDLQKITETQKVAVPIGQDMDYLDVLLQGNEALLVLFEFRKGLLLGRKIHVFENTGLSEARDIVRAFIVEYYQGKEIPGRIVCDQTIDDRDLIQSYLTEKASKKVRISKPATGEDRGILDMIRKNIEQIAADRQVSQFYRNIDEGLLELRSLFDLKEIPEEIVCFDISNLQGTDAVASMVTFRNGIPDKSNYRRFRIRGYDSPNDPGMIHEAVARRIQHLLNEELPLPDIMVIDGGPTQLARAMEAAHAFGVKPVIISIAKRFEELYYDAKMPPIRLAETSPGLKIIQQIRDEAHRFAITYHKTLRGKKLTGSQLDNVPGIGVKTRKILLEYFQSLDIIKNADIEELKKVPGIGEAAAKAVYDFFHD